MVAAPEGLAAVTTLGSFDQWGHVVWVLLYCVHKALHLGQVQHRWQQPDEHSHRHVVCHGSPSGCCRSGPEPLGWLTRPSFQPPHLHPPRPYPVLFLHAAPLHLCHKWCPNNVFLKETSERKNKLSSLSNYVLRLSGMMQTNISMTNWTLNRPHW